MKLNKLVLLFLLALLPMAIFAHAPKKLVLSYDKETCNLIVSVQHPVKDVQDHYIESLTVKVNGEIVKTLDYTFQSSRENHEVKIELHDLEPGTKVEVKAVCNKLGSKSGSLTIE